MKLTKVLKWISAGSVLVLFIMIFTPVPQATPQNTYQIEATVLNVFEGPSNDIVFSLESKHQTPYINRGIELGLDINDLNAKLKGKTATVKLVDHWTPLDFNRSSPTLAYIATEDGEILYNNIQS